MKEEFEHGQLKKEKLNLKVDNWTKEGKNMNTHN
jgi:hypothetical protein